VIPYLQVLADNGRVILFGEKYSGLFRNAVVAKNSGELIAAVNRIVRPEIILSPLSSSIRYRHTIKDGVHYLMFFNEENKTVNTTISLPYKKGNMVWIDLYTGTISTRYTGGETSFKPYEMKLLMVPGK
jgi:hypothetical protein